MEQNNEFNPYAAPAASDPIHVFGSQKTLDQVAAGFNLVYWGLVVVILCFVLLIFGSFALAGAGMRGGGMGAAQGALYFAIAMAVGMLVGAIMDLVGKFMCLAVPPETRARELIVGSVVCIVCYIIVTIVRSFVLPQLFWLALVGWVLQLAGFLLFLMFIKRIAEFISRPDLVDRAQTVIVINIVMNVLLVLMIVMAFGLGAPALLLLGMLVVGVLGIVFLVLYARLLVDARKAILGIY